ncbi:hypothetical protein BD626DRAFT_571308 [Schizophyllum amplum]|uniref:Uncharacterized protein n=1 Tax=Schizophyllum amplum TaxID=97359 RepID=A0A550C7Y2_9AGAR|nr:hypothetical protein BD626DRAFT_571308 [Auriculariopsis ampla]
MRRAAADAPGCCRAAADAPALLLMRPRAPARVARTSLARALARAHPRSHPRSRSHRRSRFHPRSRPRPRLRSRPLAAAGPAGSRSRTAPSAIDRAAGCTSGTIERAHPALLATAPALFAFASTTPRRFLPDPPALLAARPASPLRLPRGRPCTARYPCRCALAANPSAALLAAGPAPLTSRASRRSAFRAATAVQLPVLLPRSSLPRSSPHSRALILRCTLYSSTLAPRCLRTLIAASNSRAAHAAPARCSRSARRPRASAYAYTLTLRSASLVEGSGGGGDDGRRAVGVGEGSAVGCRLVSWSL